MNMWLKQKAKLILLVVLAAAVIIFLIGRNSVDNYANKYADFDFSSGTAAGNPSDTAREDNAYAQYLGMHSNAAAGIGDIAVDVFAYSDADGVAKLEELEGRPALLTEEKGFVEYAVNVPSDGLYHIYIEYYPVPSRGVDIERELRVNGEIPFRGAESVCFTRIWGDKTEVRTDNQGNELRPSQEEKPRWESSYLKDDMGYFTEPYVFYLKEGSNKIRLTGVSEPMALSRLEVRAAGEVKNYAEYMADYDKDSFGRNEDGFKLKIQGETAKFRSSPSLYAVYDRSSGTTEPASASTIQLNMIGGQNWRIAGQWIEWDFEVPADDLYRISVKARQNYNRGFVSNRAFYIDGAIPCEEAAAVPFPYNNKWSLVTLSDNEGADLLFPLTKGTHTIRMEVTHGELGAILNTMTESIYRLNEIYRKILVLTGPNPDPYRDYRIDVVYPDEIAAMDYESKVLYKLADDLTRYTGERGPQAASALTLARQLELFTQKPEKIAPSLGSFKLKISALGDGLIALSESQLDIDWLLISTADKELPKVEESFLVSAAHEIKSFLASFSFDYNSLGDTYAGGADLEVWIPSGRDQSNILKAMIDEMFTPDSGIKVNLKLVGADAVMPAIVAGIGPDVVLNVGGAEPINYAVRNAAQDLSGFDGFDEVKSWFAPSTLVPFSFNDSVYALPETQTFSLMFYRADIFEDLGIDPPDTWEDLIDIIPIIQKNNMNVGIPSVAGSGDFTNLFSQIYQRGGTLYTADNRSTLLDSETAIEAFDYYVSLYTQYKAPVQYDFVNRFRTGEMPLGFADYSVFNTLEIFAPEIRGMWKFGLMPGTKMPDGTVNRSVACGGSAVMMFKSEKNDSSESNPAAWQFMKWWVSADTQLRFGLEMESVMGASARYATANIEAFKSLSWSASQMEVLNVQRQWTVGTPEIPGGYYLTRHITNAVRRMINDNAETRETMLDYTRIINDEITKKREELGLE